MNSRRIIRRGRYSQLGGLRWLRLAAALALRLAAALAFFPSSPARGLFDSSSNFGFFHTLQLRLCVGITVKGSAFPQATRHVHTCSLVTSCESDGSCCSQQGGVSAFVDSLRRWRIPHDCGISRGVILVICWDWWSCLKTITFPPICLKHLDRRGGS